MEVATKKGVKKVAMIKKTVKRKEVPTNKKKEIVPTTIRKVMTKRKVVIRKIPRKRGPERRVLERRDPEMRKPLEMRRPPNNSTPPLKAPDPPPHYDSKFVVKLLYTCAIYLFCLVSLGTRPTVSIFLKKLFSPVSVFLGIS